MVKKGSAIETTVTCFLKKSEQKILSQKSGFLGTILIHLKFALRNVSIFFKASKSFKIWLWHFQLSKLNEIIKRSTRTQKFVLITARSFYLRLRIPKELPANGTSIKPHNLRLNGRHCYSTNTNWYYTMVHYIFHFVFLSEFSDRQWIYCKPYRVHDFR